MITVQVTESAYQDFRSFARKQDRKAVELIGEAVEFYRQTHMRRRIALRNRRRVRGGGREGG